MNHLPALCPDSVWVQNLPDPIRADRFLCGIPRGRVTHMSTGHRGHSERPFGPVGMWITRLENRPKQQPAPGGSAPIRFLSLPTGSAGPALGTSAQALARRWCCWRCAARSARARPHLAAVRFATVFKPFGDLAAVHGVHSLGRSPAIRGCGRGGRVRRRHEDRRWKHRKNACCHSA
jgi:hypothetical protein